MKAEQFPFLLKLLDDDSPVVQEEIQRALISLAPELPDLYQRFQVPWLDRLQIHRSLWGWRKSRLLAGWIHWIRQPLPHAALEMAHSSLSEFASNILEGRTLAEQLDDIAALYRSERMGVATAGDLATFLFEKRFQGDRNSYYSPDNSFLSRVIANGKGNPISLCSLFILVGQRLGLDLWGCNYPGHFLARHEQGEHFRLYDCFQGGREMDLHLTGELRGQLSPPQVETLCRAPVSVNQIVSRIIRNLVAAYLNQERRTDANLFFLLHKDLVARDKGVGDGLPLREPLFQPGQLVLHKAKGYRGVIVDYDLYVDDASGPPHEPIYRILVHRSPQVASARESTLSTDHSGSLVAHPFVTYFFSKFEDGVYFRNSKPWEK